MIYLGSVEIHAVFIVVWHWLKLEVFPVAFALSKTDSDNPVCLLSIWLPLLPWSRCFHLAWGAWFSCDKAVSCSKLLTWVTQSRCGIIIPFIHCLLSVSPSWQLHDEAQPCFHDCLLGGSTVSNTENFFFFFFLVLHDRLDNKKERCKTFQTSGKRGF